MQFTKFMKGSSNDLEDIKKEDYKKSIEFLIEDENEAISGYDRVILLVENGSADKTILDNLHNIRADELEHIEILKSILEKL